MDNSYVESNALLEDLTPEQVCYIDVETTKALELFSNEVDKANKRDTFLGFMNKTCTSTGFRLLKQEIAKPLAHVKSLEARLDCVEHLLNRCDAHALLIKELNHFGRGVDLDRLVPNLILLATRRADTLAMAEKRMDVFMTLHSIIGRISSLNTALQSVDQPLLNFYREGLDDPDFDRILDEITNNLNFNEREYSKNKRNRMLSIKTGVNDLFDIARSTYRQALNCVESYVHELQAEDHLPWKVSFSDSKGYILTLVRDKVGENYTLPEKYIRDIKTRKVITCTTFELMRLNVRANMSYENSMKLANEILVQLLESILKNASSINKLVQIIGQLDLISSLTKLASESNERLVRPKFSTFETMIESARHPVLEKMLELNHQQIVPNDVYLSTNHANFCLITGPNMGGKSVYLKQVALIQIMAQIGSFIPAKRGFIKPVNRIVVRVGSSDDGESSCSSFMSEMKGIATALTGDQNLSALYIIDEVGRGTSIEDGSAYSFAIAEDLAMKRNCFTLFSTHFPALVYLPSLFSNAKIYQFRIDTDEKQKINLLTHSLVSGYSDKCHYGIELAESCGLPMDIIIEARKCLGI